MDLPFADLRIGPASFHAKVFDLLEFYNLSYHPSVPKQVVSHTCYPQGRRGDSKAT